MPVHVTVGRPLPHTFPKSVKLERLFGWTLSLARIGLAARKVIDSVIRNSTSILRRIERFTLSSRYGPETVDASGTAPFQAATHSLP
jgi:hypothetical protein